MTKANLALVVAACIIIFLLFIVTIRPPPWGSSKSSAPPFKPREFCTNQSSKMIQANNLTLSRDPTGAYYDEQLWFGLNVTKSSLAYNVTATEQNDTQGFGPSYMLNGLSNTGLWYQVGIDWNWGYEYSTQHYQGFRFFYQVWNTTTHQSVFPNEFESGVKTFSKPVAANDTIALSLTIAGNSVLMTAEDLNSNGTASISYPSYRAHEFVGNYNVEYPNSLMTEWYHLLPYYCVEKSTVFSSHASPINSGWLAIDEWNFTGVPSNQWFNATLKRTILFDTSSEPAPLTRTVESLAANGTVIYANSTNFWTI